MAKNLTPKTVDSLITQALAIEDSEAKESGALGFMARAMVQATLPHRKVVGNEFVRTNGNYTLTIMAPSAIGLPYGTIPRLLLAWVTTEAVKTNSKELELGDSMSAFMAELGMTATGGGSGSINRLKRQTRSLFNSTVSATYEDRNMADDAGYRLADKTSLWWHSKEPEQAGLWQSSITLSDPFFKEVVDRPIPIDMRAMKALKQSPMALDIYTWLTYRVSYLKRPSVIPWSSLAMQFGSNYAELRFFKRAFLEELRKVMTVYPHVRVEGLEDGLQVRPSLTHIPMKKGPL
jgi:Plasmid encoded RepA protein